MRTSLLFLVVLAVVIGVVMSQGHCDDRGNCHDHGGTCPCEGEHGSGCSCLARRQHALCGSDADCAAKISCRDGQVPVCEHPGTSHSHCNCKHQ